MHIVGLSDLTKLSRSSVFLVLMLAVLPLEDLLMRGVSLGDRWQFVRLLVMVGRCDTMEPGGMRFCRYDTNISSSKQTNKTQH